VYFSKSSQISAPAQASALPPEPASEPPPALAMTPPVPPPAGLPPLAAPAALAPPALVPPAFVPPVVPLFPEPAFEWLPATLLAPAAGSPCEEVELMSQPVSKGRDQTRNRGAANRALRRAKRRRIDELYYVLAVVRCHWNQFRKLLQISSEMAANTQLGRRIYALAGIRDELIGEGAPSMERKIPMFKKS
jgi:hypothetical protein